MEKKEKQKKISQGPWWWDELGRCWKAVLSVIESMHIRRTIEMY